MKNSSKKTITIDDLAAMMARGFDDIRSETVKGFDYVHGQLDKIQEEFHLVNFRLESIDNNLESMDTRLTNIEKGHGLRLENVERKINFSK